MGHVFIGFYRFFEETIENTLVFICFLKKQLKNIGFYRFFESGNLDK